MEIMKNYRFLYSLIGFVGFITLLNCQNDDGNLDNEQNSNEYQIGKNRFVIDMNGDSREYYVHVPEKYDKNGKTPVVFMLHGTSGDGEKFYNFSGWKEVGENENIITVYPSSWRHCIIEEGRVKNTTKWNVYPGSFAYCAGETPRDDIQFLREIINELGQKFNIDSKRTYMVGFSNGGAMTFRCAVEMSDLFAAVVEASGTIQVDTLLTPKRNLPIFFQTGNSDDKFLGPNKDIPITSLDSLLTSAGLSPIMNTHINSFSLNSNYTVSSSLNGMASAHFNAIPNDNDRHLRFVLIENLEHAYPNGMNHPFKGAEVHWKWLEQFRLIK